VQDGQAAVFAAIIQLRAHALLPKEAGKWQRRQVGKWSFAWRAKDGAEQLAIQGPQRPPGAQAIANIVRALPQALIPAGEPVFDASGKAVALSFYQRAGMARCKVCEKHPAHENKASFSGLCSYCTEIARRNMQKLPGDPSASHGWFPAGVTLTPAELAEIEAMFPERARSE
jgi:hypothetical protein